MERLTVSELFGNYMVLQRGTEVAIWGTAYKGTKVTAFIQGKAAETTADNDGNWKIILPPLEASRSETLVVSDRSESIYMSNVAVGEVWLAGGQSNMEFFMRYDKDFQKELSLCENPDIRYYGYPVITNEKANQMRDYSEFGFWRTCNESNLQWFNAVAYYFARDLYADLKVPVGIIGVNCGGTRACCWMDEESVLEYGKVWMEDYQNGLLKIKDAEKEEEEYFYSPFTDKSNPFGNPDADRMMYGMPKEELIQLFSSLSEGGRVIGPWHEWRPTGLFHRMVEKVAPYTVRGVIWYQGESDEEHPDIYANMLEGVVKCWRRLWGRELPFIMAELAPFGTAIEPGGKFYPVLREQQELATKNIEKVWLVSTGDVGSDYDIHPKEKQPVGKRMALTARGHVYQEDILCDPPVLLKAERTESGVRIEFEHAVGGLSMRGDHINSLSITQIDDNNNGLEKIDYSIELLDNSIFIAIPEKYSHSRIEIAFAKTPYYEVNVYNEAGFPVRPFRCLIE